MRANRTAWVLGLTAALASGCDRQPDRYPIFVDGRAAAPAGDTLLAVTHPGLPGLEITERRSDLADTIGLGLLHSPHHVEYTLGRWYVSDIEDGQSSIVVLRPDGQLDRRISLSSFEVTPHQFAVLPGGRVIVETPQRLAALDGDSLTTFAAFPAGGRSGLLVSAMGGVVHALPGRHITLYNEFGGVRWRLDWPWLETAFVTDIAVDPNGRIHVIAGVPSDGTFIVYNLAATTGEVLRWSVPGPYASFSVDHFGRIQADTSDAVRGR